ncbi:MAG: thioredoxin [Legionellales bacterium RIFCSPHIGHO2_12_FULL_35_11]|nr:MAG: thioredoxin [Legionellales bacterium RIFCSPHIGHO2_12_FULL_35_11]
MSATAKVQNITDQNFEDVIANNEIVFIDFWAKWCAPCKNFAPVYESIAKLYPKVVFGQVNIENEQELAEAFAIRSIPHLMVFKRGIVIYSESGSMPESTLKELVEQAISADISNIS